MPRLCLPGHASPARTHQQPWTLGSASSLLSASRSSSATFSSARAPRPRRFMSCTTSVTFAPSERLLGCREGGFHLGRSLTRVLICSWNGGVRRGCSPMRRVRVAGPSQSVE